MKISESQLRKIIQVQLKEFRLPEKDIDLSSKKLSPQDVASALDKAIGGTHASGRKFNSVFTRSLNESKKEAIDMSSDEIFERVLNLSTLSKNFLINPNALTYDSGETLQSPDLEIVKSIIVFTGGNVPTIRNPSLYDANKVKALKRTTYLPKKNDYEIANVILSKLAVHKLKESELQPIFRGLRLNKDIAKSIVKGIEFNNWTISSWTSDIDVAHDFSIYAPGGDDVIPVVLKILDTSHGCSIQDLSIYPTESEYLLGKKIKVDYVEDGIDRGLGLFVYCSIIG